MDDTANPRVQAHAAAALVNFSDDCPKTILTTYLDNIVAKLEAVLASKLREVGTTIANNKKSDETERYTECKVRVGMGK